MQFATITPAYGRDYKASSHALMDWNAGKDFRLDSVFNHTYCSVRDAAALAECGIEALVFRFDNLSKIYVVELDTDYLRMLESNARMNQCMIEMSKQHTDRR